MIYSFHPEARLEFLDAINYYEDCQEDLGLEFSREIFATIQKSAKALPVLQTTATSGPHNARKGLRPQIREEVPFDAEKNRP